MAGKKLMSPNNSIYVVPLAGVADLTALKATEVLAGTNVSRAVVVGYTLGATKSDVDTSKDITQEGDVETPTFGNYEGEITFYRSDLVDVDADYDAAWALFKDGRSEVVLVHRLGLKNTVAVAATQEVSWYSFTADYPKIIEGDKGAPIQFSVKFQPLGAMKLNQPLG